MFKNEKVDLYFNSQSIRSCFLSDNLYKLYLAFISTDYSLNAKSVSVKGIWFKRSLRKKIQLATNFFITK